MASRVVNFVYFGMYLGAFVLFVLAFSCPWWYERGNESYGLFKKCYRDQYGTDWKCSFADFGQMGGGSKGSMALMVMALFVNVPNFILTILVIVRDFKIFISAILCLVGGVLTLLGVAIFGGNFDGDTENIGWAYALGCVSMALLIITAISIILADRLGTRRDPASPRTHHGAL